MKEDFLQLLWQQQLLNRQVSWWVDAEPLTVVKPGFRNSGAGPDFHHAKIRIGNLEWNGSIEIHVKASEWNLHGHTQDPAYQSVILHVVWENDQPVYRADGTVVPAFELKDKVPLKTILRYRSLLANQTLAKPCSPFLPELEPLVFIAMQERVLVERLERKSADIVQRWNQNDQNWLETFYQTIAHTLGLKANADSMLRLAQLVPCRMLASQGWHPDNILTILLGASGMINPKAGPENERQAIQYQFFKAKYQLENFPLLWQNFRIRPASRPLMRILILGLIAARIPDWFAQLTEAEHPAAFFSQESLPPLPAWTVAFLAEAGVEEPEARLTQFLKNSLVINAFAPFLTALSLQLNNRVQIEKALEWLSEIKAERNSILDQWKGFPVEIRNAAQSQALLELSIRYCHLKRCLDCSVGSSVLSERR